MKNKKPKTLNYLIKKELIAGKEAFCLYLVKYIGKFIWSKEFLCVDNNLERLENKIARFNYTEKDIRLHKPAFSSCVNNISVLSFNSDSVYDPTKIIKLKYSI